MTNDKDSAVRQADIAFNFLLENKPVMTIHADGRVTLSDDAQPTEAAAACIEAMSDMMQDRIENAALRQPTQSDALREVVIEECAKALEADAKKCDCFALEERECGCGAWCEWKSITSARAVEIVRELVDKP